MQRHVNVIGVGMTQFKTPKNADPYTIMGATAGGRRVADATVALQHNIGLGGCCVVTLYERCA